MILSQFVKYGIYFSISHGQFLMLLNKPYTLYKKNLLTGFECKILLWLHVNNHITVPVIHSLRVFPSGVLIS